MSDENPKNAEDLQRELAETRRQLALQQAAQRVHNAVLAMEKSDDLVQVAATMYRELMSLGVETPAISFQLIDEESEDVWACGACENPRRQGISWASPDLVEIDGELTVFLPQVHQSQSFPPDFIERWRAGQLWSRKSEEVADKIEKLMEIFGLDRPIPGMGPGWMVTNVPFAHGTVGFRERKFREESVVAVQALTEALSAGYLRFLDFQRLEEQARQAQVEAGLERIRSQALAMDTSADLPSVAAALYHETNALYGDAFNVGISVIGIVDEEQDLVTQWTVLPEDASERWSEDDYVDGDVHVQIELFTLSALRSIDAYWKKAARARADADRKGHFELAHGGTLFLDEVGDMPPDLQAKLLRVLEDGVIAPLGGEARPVDVRVLSATNTDLQAAVGAATFRRGAGTGAARADGRGAGAVAGLWLSRQHSRIEEYCRASPHRKRGRPDWARAFAFLPHRQWHGGRSRGRRAG